MMSRAEFNSWRRKIEGAALVHAADCPVDGHSPLCPWLDLIEEIERAVVEDGEWGPPYLAERLPGKND
jgi:hypothetical protein